MSTGITRLANVIIPVADQDRELQFYTEALGLEKRADVPFGDGNRWIEVAPPGADTPIAICPPGPGVTPGGKDTGISLQTDDNDGYHGQLKDRGVDVDAEVSRFGDAVPPLFWLRRPRRQHADGRRGSMTQSAGTIAARLGDGARRPVLRDEHPASSRLYERLAAPPRTRQTPPAWTIC